ncbi:MAG: hypothetical protein JW744_00310, partial [Candidatus Diapherotrites archaeon]|nr:hypothetical protein [Candidatus Diapherotrites archaeon]
MNRLLGQEQGRHNTKTTMLFILLVLAASTTALLAYASVASNANSTDYNTESCLVQCYRDSECDDSIAGTIDICNNDGMYDSFCSNVPTLPMCDIACRSDSDCDDGNFESIDICNRDGTCESFCTNVQITPECDIACRSDSDCDDGNFESIDICNSDGQCSAECSHVSGLEAGYILIESVVDLNEEPDSVILIESVVDLNELDQNALSGFDANLPAQAFSPGFSLKGRHGMAIAHSLRITSQTGQVVRERPLPSQAAPAADANTLPESAIPAGLYRVELELEDETVNAITLENAAIDGNLDLLEVELLSDTTANGLEVKRPFLFNPKTGFEAGSISLTPPEGTNTVLKCRDWNSGTGTCSGEWQTVAEFTGTGPISITVSPEDPVFGFIEITKAMHLDQNKEFISDICQQVKEKDNLWSEPIYHGEYVRVEFERLLTERQDIGIYVRNPQGLDTLVEIYYQGSEEKIAEFPVITEERQYKVYLTGMAGVQDKFDLRVKNLDSNPEAFLEFDRIIDAPDSNNFYVNAFDATATNWTQRTGTSPFLWDTDVDFINTILQNKTDSFYGFWDLPAAATAVSSVILYIESTQGAGEDDTVTFSLQATGVALFTAATITPLNTGYSWQNSGELAATLDTVAKVNSAEMQIVSNKVGSSFTSITLRRAYLYVDYVIPVANIAPDANIWQVDGQDFNAALPSFSYSEDGNLTIKFRTTDPDSDDLNFNMWYGESGGAKTTVVIRDINLSTNPGYGSCDTNAKTGMVCSWDWNISGIADNNYWITLEVNDGSDSNTVTTEKSFRVNPVAPSLDVNVSSPNGYEIIGVRDGNASIDFNVQSTNDYIMADIYFSKTSGGAETSIIQDLNLQHFAKNPTTDINCTGSGDFSTTQQCHYDWNVSVSLPSGRFLIDINLHTNTYDTNKIDSSDQNFRLHNWLQTAVTPSGDRLARTLERGTDGTLYLVFEDNITDENQTIYFTQSDDNGTTWDTPVRLTDANYHSYNPRIDINSENGMQLVWQQQDTANWNDTYSVWMQAYDLYYASCPKDCNNASNWLKTNIDSSDINAAYYPTILVTSDDNIHISYQDVNATWIPVVQRRTLYTQCAGGCHNTTNWSTPVPTNVSGITSNEKELRELSTGKIVQIGIYVSSIDYLYYTECSSSCTTAGNWSAQATIASLGGASGIHDLAMQTDSNNTVYVAYGTSEDGGPSGISYLTRFKYCPNSFDCTNSANWTLGTIADRVKTATTNYDITLTSNGTNLYAFWSDNNKNVNGDIWDSNKTSDSWSTIAQVTNNNTGNKAPITRKSTAAETGYQKLDYVWYKGTAADYNIAFHTEVLEAPAADSCTPSASGHWNIKNGDVCTLSSDCSMSGGFLHIVNGTLKIPNGKTLAVPAGYKVIVEKGTGKLVIEKGGRLVIHKSAASPFLYIINGPEYSYFSDFIPGAIGKEKEYTSYSNITIADIVDGKIKLKITEEKDEIAYIDRLFLQVDGKEIIELDSISYADKAILAESDGRYLVMGKGQEYFLEFPAPESYTRIDFAAEGYFIEKPEKRQFFIEAAAKPGNEAKAGFIGLLAQAQPEKGREKAMPNMPILWGLVFAYLVLVSALAIRTAGGEKQMAGNKGNALGKALGKIARLRKTATDRVIAAIARKGEPASLKNECTSTCEDNRAVLCISHNRVFLSKLPVLVGIVLCILMISPMALAIPELFTVQGRLTDGSGSALTGSYTFEFLLYDGNSTDKNVLWSETRSLSVSNGIFNVVLGDANTDKRLNLLDFNNEMWLGMYIDGEEQTPLIRFSSIGSAFVSKKTMGIDLNAFQGFSDFNTWYHSIFDLNTFYYKMADVNTHFVPYIGATRDFNLNFNDLNVRDFFVRDINALGDINVAGSVSARYFFGDGSQLTNLPSSSGGTVSMDVNDSEQAWLFGLDLNFASVSDFNSRYHSVFDLNTFYYKNTDVNAHFYGIVDLNANFYGKLDVNSHFVPYAGATKDVNLATHAIYASRFVSSDAKSASGANATALGLKTTATGNSSFAGGYPVASLGSFSNITSSGTASFAYGYATTAPGTANITSSSFGSVAMGYCTSSAGGTSEIISSGSGSIALGAATNNQTLKSANYGSVAMGYAELSGVSSGGLGSVAMGFDTKAFGTGSVSLGYDTNANADYATAIGYKIFNNKTMSVALGPDVNVARDLNVGSDVNVLGDVNVKGSIAAAAFFGDGSGLENVSASADVNGQDLNVHDVNSFRLQAG